MIPYISIQFKTKSFLQLKSINIFIFYTLPIIQPTTKLEITPQKHCSKCLGKFWQLFVSLFWDNLLYLAVPLFPCLLREKLKMTRWLKTMKPYLIFYAVSTIKDQHPQKCNFFNFFYVDPHSEFLKVIVVHILYIHILRNEWALYNSKSCNFSMF